MQLFGNRRGKKSLAVGIASGQSGIAVAILNCAKGERPRVVDCALLSSAPAELEAYCRTHNLRRAHCVDSLAPGRYDLMPVDVQSLKPEERIDAIRWQIRELLEYPAADAVIDLINIPVFGSEDNIKNQVVAAPRAFLQERIDFCKGLDLQLQTIDIAEFSLRNLLELYQEDARGLCFLWIRENSSLLIVTRGDIFYFSRLINTGLSQLNLPAATETEAPLSEILQQQLDTIVLEIQRSIDYCESNFRLPQIPRILVAVCGPESPLLLDYLNSYLQADVDWADFRQIFDLSLELDPSLINACLPALGAALRAGGRA